jgi:hypothetical protein
VPWFAPGLAHVRPLHLRRLRVQRHMNRERPSAIPSVANGEGAPHAHACPANHVRCLHRTSSRCGSYPAGSGAASQGRQRRTSLVRSHGSPASKAFRMRLKVTTRCRPVSREGPRSRRERGTGGISRWGRVRYPLRFLLPDVVGLPPRGGGPLGGVGPYTKYISTERGQPIRAPVE